MFGYTGWIGRGLIALDSRQERGKIIDALGCKSRIWDGKETIMDQGKATVWASIIGVFGNQMVYVVVGSLAAGALGGKLLGAGGGGFMLFVVNKEHRRAVRERLKDLIHVSFDFDDGGSKIVVFEPDELLNGR